MRLPLAGQALPALADAKAMPALAGSGLRVLVADDNADAAASLSMLLSLAGNEVRTASDGSSGSA